MANYRVKLGCHIICGKNLRVGNTFEVKGAEFPKREDFDRFFERVGGKCVSSVIPSVVPSINPDGFQDGLSPVVEEIDDLETEKAEKPEKPEKVEKVNKGGRTKKADAALEIE